MNYPVWDVPFLGAGLVVAIIAIIHVLISHLAIGGGAFLFVAEWWSDRQSDGPRIRQWLHRFATFFLIYTTVFGAMTGVGIWFAIQLASPEATSLLIHQFVFAWAIEWVAFLGELTILYLYYYGWHRNSRRLQVFLAGAYFVIAWMSLFVINGILTFMLTPGGWTLENTDIWAGFFNPGFWPALVIRTLVMLLLAGLAGILVATRIVDEPVFKARIIRFCARWIVPAALLVPLFTIWYWSTLPENTVKLVLGGVVGVGGGKLEVITRHFWLAGISGALVIIGTLVVAIRPQAASTAAAIALLLIAQLGIMGGEFFREMARKPHVVRGVLYSNSLWQADGDDETVLKKEFLERARWHPGTQRMSLEHGEWVFRLQCASCHTRNGYRGIRDRTAEWTRDFGFRWLDTMDAQGVMPPFQGSRWDKAALTAYLWSLNGREGDGTDVMMSVLEKERAEAAKKAAKALEDSAGEVTQ